MSFLLDTNVVSEPGKPRPDGNVLAWMRSTAGSIRYLSALVLGEVRRGIELLRPRDPMRAMVYETWLTQLGQDYGDQILPVTGEIAEEWARMSIPDPLPTVDGLMVATAKVHDLTFVTRNTAGLERTGVPLLNPWIPG